MQESAELRPLVSPVNGNGKSNDLPASVRTLPMRRLFTRLNIDPFTYFEWTHRNIEITNAQTGKVLFKLDNAEFPKQWSDNAADITAEKYFRYVLQQDLTKKQETSVREMVSRVAGTITQWGRSFGYFDEQTAQVFFDELAFILTSQSASFNSPVWFNIGTLRGAIGQEQASACFINSIEDDMDSILELGKTEGKLYKGGSGSGVNYSPLRSSREGLSGGGTASGPVPFMAKDDANGGAIKSGGTTRRAAKMNLLDITHGDIVEFIWCKARAEKMAHALIDAGFESDFRSRFGAYQSVPFQNANHSVRVTDEFMKAVQTDGYWHLMTRDGRILDTVKARQLWDDIAMAAWICGDPGLQFDTTINNWHTCSQSGRISASNPCSEYMHLDDSACNLASINLRKFQNDDGSLDLEKLQHTVDVMITAMDILVSGAGYPTQKIGDNARKFRQLGLGFANLGSYLMSRGLPYDSEEARFQTSMVMAIICGRAYRRSAELAASVGPFAGFSENRQPMHDVILKHCNALEDVHQEYSRTRPLKKDEPNLFAAAQLVWHDARAYGWKYGYRNSQATVLAPTGTIAFMMDCDTTGIEPDLAMVKTKKLVGGGTMKIVNEGVKAALARLGYAAGEALAIDTYMREKGSVVGAPHIHDEHLAVFDSSFPEPIANRYLRADSHVLMMAAAQPFISGAISKTVNLPKDASEQEIARLYMLAWKSGLKAIAVYRDGCKRTQPLQNAKAKDVEETLKKTAIAYEEQITELKAQIAQLQETNKLHRKKLPRQRKSETVKFRIGEHKGYLTMGMYPDGSLGEIFVKMNKEGSTVSGLMDTIATLTSIALQHGVPLKAMSDKFKHMTFDPQGWTDDEEIRHASSIIDYIFRLLEMKFLEHRPIEVIDVQLAGIGSDKPVKIASVKNVSPTNGNGESHSETGVTCPDCGRMMQRTGTCMSCRTCGFNAGCG